MQCPRCLRPTVVEDSRGSDTKEAMRLQVRIIEQAFREDDRLRPHIDKLPFRLRRRRCPEGHVTWTIEADSDLLLLLLDRIELADLLP